MTPKQRQNTINLLSIIKNKIDNGDRWNLLDAWVQPCGTVGCVLGDYVLTYEEDLIQELLDSGERSTSESAISMICNHYPFYEEFGFDPVFKRKEDKDEKWSLPTGNVIGDSSEGTLQERYDYVKSVLEAEEKNG